MPNNSYTELNPGSGGSKMDETLLTVSGESVHSPRVVIRGDDAAGELAAVKNADQGIAGAVYGVIARLVGKNPVVSYGSDAVENIGTTSDADTATTVIGRLKKLVSLFAGGLPAALGVGGGLKVDGSGTALPVSGTVTANAGTGTFTVDGSGVTQPVALQAGAAIVGKFGIDQTTPGTTNGVQVNAALPAGTNNIGDVDVLSLPTLPTGSNIIGRVSVDQTTPGLTNGVQVNAALPAGSNLIGSVTSVGAAASGAAASGNPVLIAGSDGTNARSLAVDTGGRQIVVGTAGDGASPVGNSVAVAGVDGSGKVRTILVDTSNRAWTVPSGFVAAGAAASLNPIYIGGADGSGNVRAILTTATGAVQTYDGRTALTVSAPATASITTSSAQIIAANTGRTGLIITNTHATSWLYLAIGAAATAVSGSGIALAPNGGVWTMDGFSFSTAKVVGIASAGTITVAVQEFA